MVGIPPRRGSSQRGNPYEQNAFANFFDAEWMFGLVGGFDVVVANPPYIDSENMTNTNPELRALIQESYSMTKGNWDIYIAFYEKSFGLMNNDGVLSFITPDKWISKPFGDEMRRQTTDKIISILKAGRNVFESSNVDAIVTVFANRPQMQLQIFDIKNKEIVPKRVINKKSLKPPYAYDWLFSDSIDIFAKLEAQPSKLSGLGICENACATSDAYKLKDFLQEMAKSNGQDEYLKIINTGTIGKFVSKWGRREMVYLGQRYLKPVVHKKRFLAAFQNSYGRKSVKPKLIVKGLNLLDACLDSEGTIIPGKTTLMITSGKLEALKFLLGIINSKVAFFYLKEKYPASSYNQGTTFTKEMINELPVPKLTDQSGNKVVSSVEHILAVMQRNPGADTSTLQDELNKQVYALYGLTAEEIKIVEAASA
jgi:adenine-specific DNA-methyltransferase